MKILSINNKKKTCTDSLPLKQTTHYCIANQTFVFVGNEDIVHLAGEDTGNDGINGNIDSGHLFTVCGTRFNKAYAKVDNFWNVVADSRAKINNNKDKKCK